MKPLTDDKGEVRELTLADMRAMKGIDSLPESLQRVLRSRGRPKVEAPKQSISIRLDADVLSALRESGPGWQGRVNAMLKDALRRGRL